MKADTDVIVIGGGLVGGSVACALSNAGLRVAVVEAVAPGSAQQPSFDERTIALTYSARQIFSGLQLWENLSASGELWPIRDIEVSDRGDTGLCHLSCRDVGMDALGYVVPTRVVGRVLHEQMVADERIDLHCPANTLDVQREGGQISARVSAGQREYTLAARLLVLADGGRSPLARQQGFEALTKKYGQSALVAIVGTDRAHDGKAFERFIGTGPLALLPVRERDFAVAWTLNSDQAQNYVGLNDAAIVAELQSAFGDRAGNFGPIGPRKVYALDLTRVAQPPDRRLVAVGNAAHIVHPVAGQGFNLGLRDAVALADCLSQAAADGRDIGSPEIIGPYLRGREEETRRVYGFTDAMIGVFGSTFAPVRRGRNAALNLIDKLPAAKRELLWRTTGMGSVHSRVVQRIADANEPSVAADDAYDIVIVGAGLIGGAMACALGDTDFRVALVDKALPEPLPTPLGDFDLRINAYNRAAEQLLRNLGVWQRLPADRMFPFRRVYVGNERGSGSVKFSSFDVGETHLGHFIENRLVTRQLIDRALELPNIDVLTGRDIAAVQFGTDRVLLNSGDAGPLQARLLIGADGANSGVREAAGIGVRVRPYAQRCIVGTIEFTGDLEETAWQRFLYTGPLGLLPLAPGFCSLAWSCENDLSARLMEMPEAEFIDALHRATEGRLGTIRRVHKRAVFPLMARNAVAYAGARTALIGDAAHVVHPLAGLGANIGFMDVVTLAGLLQRARGRDFGGARLLRRYERKRRGENHLLMSTMSAFNSVFSNDDGLLGTIRNGGLRLADQIVPAKNLLIRRAMWMDFSPLGRSGYGGSASHPGEAGEQAGRE